MTLSIISRKISDHFQASVTKTYQKSDIITHAGESPEGIALLREGIVEQYSITPEGGRVTVNVYKPGAFFPMSWAINKTPNEYFFAALSDVTLQFADADRTVAFLQNNPDVAFDLLSRVYKGTDALLRRLVITASGKAASRLLFELLIEAYRFSTPRADGTAHISIQRHVIASRTGLARETVSRELQKLHEQKLITLSGRTITLNVSALEAAVAKLL